MGTDRARNSYDASRKYRSVVAQEGHVSVETDANEAEEVRAATHDVDTLDAASIVPPRADGPDQVKDPKWHVYRGVLLWASAVIVVVVLIGVAFMGAAHFTSAPGSTLVPTLVAVATQSGVAVSPSTALAVASVPPKATEPQSSAAVTPGLPTIAGPSASATLTLVTATPTKTAEPAPPAPTPVSSLTRTPAPTNSAPPPTSTPKPTPPLPTSTPAPTAAPTKPPVIVFTVSPKAADGNCKSGLASFSLLLDNTGSNVSVSWSISFTASGYLGDWGTAKPASGDVPAGKSAFVTITPQALCPVTEITDYFLKVTYGGSDSATVTYTVMP